MSEYRRKLPHFHPDDTYLFLTWRLWGSLPGTLSAAYPSGAHAFVAADRVLDRRVSGPLWLKDPRIAGMVAQALLTGETGHPFWQDESFDRYLHDSRQLERTVAYIEENPVAAGLVA
jgi:hypothetical protein